MDHDPRIIEDELNITKGYMRIQCLNCGCVFRPDGYNAAAALLDCAEERNTRNDIMVESMPMMVSPTSEKYAIQL